MNEGRPQTRRQRVEEKEFAIIAAARTVFVEHGFDKAKIAEIAKLAGVAEGTVYLYFENKQAVLLAVATDFYQRLTRDAADGIKPISGTIERLEFLARHHMERVANEWRMLSLAMTPFRFSAEYRQTEAYQLNRAYVEVFDQVIREGINRGEVRADVPISVMRDVFYGGLEYATRTLLLRPSLADAEMDQVVGHFMQILTAGILTGQEAAAASPTPADKQLASVARRLERVAAKLEATDKPTGDGD